MVLRCRPMVAASSGSDVTARPRCPSSEMAEIHVEGFEACRCQSRLAAEKTSRQSLTTGIRPLKFDGEVQNESSMTGEYPDCGLRHLQLFYKRC